MTDNEIIKALECCILANYTCPMLKNKDCFTSLRKNALDLITRQQAELENSKVENQSLRSAANSLKMHYEEAQAEVKRLKNAYKQCAWERDVFSEDIKQEIKKDCSYLMLDIKNIKSEAYKEFAERLKELIRTKEFTDDVAMLLCAFIDNICKEMVGEDNA